ncbi:MAG TPA: RraA family protein [Anaerolineae bacterium]|nr:RraA family protein [Anaerolineae bacterium]
MNATGKVSKDIIEGLRSVTVASVTDALWEMGISGHLSHEIKPVLPAKMVGPAVTVYKEPTTERLPPTHILELIDSAEPGSVIVIAIDGYKDSATWGGLMTTGAVVNGLEGALLDGGVRDVEEIERDYSFPIFARSIHPAASVGRFKTVSSNEPVEIDGVLIRPGDVIMGDRDGVVVIPVDKAEECLKKALEIEAREREQTRHIQKTKSIREGLDKYQRI